MVRILLLCLGIAIGAGINFATAGTQTGPQIKLVLQVTIDGLRADLINRYQQGFGPDGFRIVQDPYWFLYEKGPVAAMHGSPWRYDTHVPIIFMGPVSHLNRYIAWCIPWTSHRLLPH